MYNSKNNPILYNKCQLNSRKMAEAKIQRFEMKQSSNYQNRNMRALKKL